MSDHLFDLMMDGMEFEEDKQKRTTFKKAPFSIAGSKYQCLKHLIEILPYRNKWVDVFGGTGVVSLNRQISPMLNIFNDVNSAVTNFFRCLRDRQKLKQMLEYLDLSVTSREDFLICKETWKGEQDDALRAAKWWYMVRFSVLGRCSSFARATNSHSSSMLRGYHEPFNHVHRHFRKFVIENQSFEMLFQDYDSEDTVFYCDPPYVGTDTATYQGSWTRDDQIRLLRCIERAKGYVALSGYKNELNDSCDFWDEEYNWPTRIIADVQAYTPENYREDRKHLGYKTQEREYLWVRH